MSIRDVIFWVSFMNSCIKKAVLTPGEAFINGACMVLLDGLGVGLGLPESTTVKLRNECLQVLYGKIPICEIVICLQNA